MTVIANSLLMVRRIGDLNRRRDQLLERQDQLRRRLPDWAVAPLKLVGMSAREIESLVVHLSKTETEAGLDQIEGELDRLDRQIEELENQLLSTPSRSLEGIDAVLALALNRLRGQTPTDPQDVFYDYGDARVLFMLERAAEDLHAILHYEARRAG